jgi:hypothetical protein
LPAAGNTGKKRRLALSSRRKGDESAKPPRLYRGAEALIRAIRRFAREVAERFKPTKIVLSGTQAHGAQRADGDVARRRRIVAGSLYTIRSSPRSIRSRAGSPAVNSPPR